ncbi:hypothetical protein AO1008_03293 [Aspergillus oryzae 100-8]|uniref:Uncharacterized protein n=1 Tax=Aspergillus oryzae (strain 3.042) TaxID=1160506 RepID=I8IVD1_ASPO3|nr:hypothetical protein Ao3042_11261 [Aspergillus oryzae 3.042]KDE77322.1 hypothetical protein AO1008_03293 [Aspergillus oryzae 100-8]|eukprot:EIT83436.1 hypothetical protein Ao3042_11261 [Aspergillus oryzae 3.042]
MNYVCLAYEWALVSLRSHAKFLFWFDSGLAFSAHLFSDLSRFKFINTSLTSLTRPRNPEAFLCVASRRYFFSCLLYDTILETIVILGPDYDLMPWSFGYLFSFTALDHLVSRHMTAIGNKYNLRTTAVWIMT